MARIAGVNIPSQKRVPIGLTYIHGIGPSMAAQICAWVRFIAKPPLMTGTLASRTKF